MSNEIRVPDIGDFADVDVIEVLIKAGDTVSAGQSVLVLESDKASRVFCLFYPVFCRLRGRKPERVF